MKVLALVEAPDHVCCRYRVRAFEPALGEANHRLEIAALARGFVSRFRQLQRAAEFDCVILQRKLLPRPLLYLLRRNARRLVFDFDDAILYRDSFSDRGFHDPRRLARFRTTVRLADVVLAGNSYLRACAIGAGASSEKVRIQPTCVDPRDYPVRNRPSRSVVDLVWIGSSSTLRGLEMQASLWRRLGRQVPGLRLRLICDRFASFDPLETVPVNWSQSAEAAELANSDIGISWIPDDPWSRGKCGLKVLQYQAAALPTVANPVGVHPEIIRPGRNGELCRTEDEWVAAVSRLAADTQLRRRMGQAAREDLELLYSASAWSTSFVDAVTGRPRPTRSVGSPHLAQPPISTEGSHR